MGKGIGKKLLSLIMALALAITTLAVPGNWGGGGGNLCGKQECIRKAVF